jgi:photosystem II stability/assembly factor-like uncharacterized protein
VRAVKLHRWLVLVLAWILLPNDLGLAAPDFSQLLRWRNVGPFRGGRTRAVCGVPSQPNLFYMAPVNGGVFRSDDAGRTWQPIFDDQPTASVGAIAVSISNPKVIYVGSGEGLHRPDLSVGNGLYKSTDAGRTWVHLGLRDGQQIAQIAVDPRNSDHLLVAVAGHPYGPNEERGIFLSTDGGRSFRKTLFKDENTGGNDVQFDPQNSQTVYASLWEAREGPWENGDWSGGNGGIFKSADGGQTWKQLQGGLPNDISQANLAIAPSAPEQLFAAVATPRAVRLYRSSNGGGTWTVATEDERPGGRIGGGDLPVIRFDPKDPKVVYSASVVCWKSTDGGQTWTGWRGAPGGDDYQNIWINSNDPRIVLLGSDQGAIVTLNGGDTWSSWYNQPTAQLYHVSADSAFPYQLYSGQQESGSVGIASRGPDGQITFRDWEPVAAEEYGYVTPDPLDPDLIYGGKLSRYDRRTRQVQEILPKPFRSDEFRVIRTEPIVFSPFDPRRLWFAANTLWETLDRGRSWKSVSPDLTRATYEVPPNVGKYRDQPTAQPRRRGVIYAVAPSPLEKNRIWAGTDDGVIHLTTDDGKTWHDVTPPQIGPWWKISVIEASHFDAKTAFAAVNTLRLDDLRPHIFRTTDDGRRWEEIVHGLPNDENINVVREDPQRRGLLFAGSERGAYVSFNTGDDWQSLRFNLPATSVRDLIVKDDDLAIATHGRGFWIMDNITPLRQLSPDDVAATRLLKPQLAIRYRDNSNTDTPLPPDEPAGENPVEGAIIDYSVGAEVSGPVLLEIRDAKGKVVRRYASTDPTPTPDPNLKIPRYWIKPPAQLPARAGWHRFAWDLHGQPLPGAEAEYPMTAVAHRTTANATAPWVPPGEYQVSLTTNGKTLTQPLTVKMDPRIRASIADLTQQWVSSEKIAELRKPLEPLAKSYTAIVRQLEKLTDARLDQVLAEKAAGLRRKLEPFANPATLRDRERLEFDLLEKVKKLFNDLQQADTAPTAQQLSALDELERATQTAIKSWETIPPAVASLNAQLTAAGLPPITLE